MATDVELKACPFCGGSDIRHEPGNFIACMNINCGGQVDIGSPWGGSKEDGIAFLIATWNTRPEPTQEQREAVARLAALHGIGRIDGMGNREPPNEKWTQGEWERRILECVPGAVELQCYALADAILALLQPQGRDHV